MSLILGHTEGTHNDFSMFSYFLFLFVFQSVCTERGNDRNVISATGTRRQSTNCLAISPGFCSDISSSPAHFCKPLLWILKSKSYTSNTSQKFYLFWFNSILHRHLCLRCWEGKKGEKCVYFLWGNKIPHPAIDISKLIWNFSWCV